MEDLFSLHDVLIRTSADSRELLDAGAHALLYKGAERIASDVASADVSLSLSRAATLPLAPSGAEVTGSFGTDFHIYHDDSTFVACGPGVHVAVRPTDHRAEVVYTDAAGEVDAFYGLAFAVITLLRAKGFFGLHAAALVRRDRGLLLVASSDSGKSTAAFTLVQQGWQYVTDDALLLQKRGSKVMGLSFRRDFCVDPDAAEHFPELADRKWAPSPSDPGKWRVEVESLFPGRHLRECTPRVILFPSLSSEDETRLEPIAQRTAFEHLMMQSAALATPLPAWVQSQMQISSRLLAQCRYYRLATGRDVLDAPERFSGFLTDVLLNED